MKQYLYILFICLAHTANAQNENNIWFWGYNNVLDFNTEKPTASVLGKTVPYTGCATVCNANGSLLFYTDNMHIYDRMHRIMPNGANIKIPDLTRSQPWEPLVVPFINDPGKYYVFTLHGNFDSVLYSVVDMSLNDGYGDVVENQKKVALKNVESASFLKAVEGDGCFVWLLTHAVDSNKFYAYKIDESGISTEPVISWSGFYDGRYSYLTPRVSVSNDNKKIAMAINALSLELHSFNNRTGVVSDALLLAEYRTHGRVHSTCFSPDGSKLYITGGPDGDGLIQFNVNALPYIDSVEIFDTTGNINGELRPGPDGKIYISDWYGLYTILYPDRQGNACALKASYVTLPPESKTRPHSLGNNVIRRPVVQSSMVIDTIVCGDSLVLTVMPETDAYTWYDGDTGTVKRIDQPGKIWLTSRQSCYLATDTFNIEFTRCNCNPFLPNAFTPNRDGRNDWFGVGGYDVAEAFLIIYDRWGKQVFSSANPANKWDGKFQGIFCDIGAYYYYCKIKCINGREKVLKGDVLLLR